jgi:hypothetical protein
MADAHHPQCVLVAPEIGAARALADWLTDKGFPAEAVPPPAVAAVGDSLGISGETISGIEVRVIKPEHVEPARQAISEQKAAIEAVRAKHKARAARTGTTTAVCEECGKSSTWPAAEMGTTQDCPHCGQYMDIPDPDEDWEGVDFEAQDEETEDTSDEPKPEKP